MKYVFIRKQIRYNVPIDRRLTFYFRLWTNQKNALVGISSAMADIGDVVLQQI